MHLRPSQSKIESCGWQLAIPLLVFGTVFGVLTLGCHRGYYRRQADREVQRLIGEKSCDPRWNHASDGSIKIDPQSRMFDPFSLDHPPIPPDDPWSHSLMQCVHGRRGYPHWHANGDTSFVANPEWRAYLPINDKGQVIVDVESAYQMALVHSPNLQTQREQLYLSALDVSIERFGFDSQLFAGFNSFLTNQGSDRGEGTILSVASGANGEGITFSKLGITGTTFVVGLANSILWNFSGANTQAATGLIDFTLIQPLLRGAGRERILEALTQSERNLLADVRQLDRFRRGFYLNVVTGRNPGAGPGTNFLAQPIGVGGVGGYIGLLQQQQQIRIQEFNVRQLENVLEQFREFFRRERINSLQVRQFEGTLYNAQNVLLSLKTNYQTSLDNFKLQLGLPPDVELIVDDDLLDRFEFISDEITNRQITINILRNTTGEALNLIDEFCPASIDEVREDEFQWPEGMNERIADLLPFISKANELIEKINSVDKSIIQSDLEKLSNVRSDRLSYLGELRASIDRGEILADVEPMILQPESILKAEKLTEQLSDIFGDLSRIQKQLAEIKSRIENFDDAAERMTNVELYNLIREQIGTETSERLTELSKATLELSLVQAQARGNSIGLPKVDIADDFAFRVAKCFRRDLMNARAALVDQWRQIEFFANDLESQFDLVLEGELGNDGNNPFSFRSSNGAIRGGFRFDAPIVRLNERNNYRAALINYQQARRDYYQFEDEVHANLRQILREINLNKILFELNRQNLQAAIAQVENAQFALEDPSATSLGATTARDLTQAISAVQQAQTQFLNVWVNFEVLRRSLDFDLGTFQLGPDMSWIDPEVIDDSVAFRAAAMMGIDVNDQCYCELDFVSAESFVEQTGEGTSDSEALNYYSDSTEIAPFKSQSEPPQSDLAPPPDELLDIPLQPPFEPSNGLNERTDE